MEIKKRRLNGTFDISLKPNFDERGFFMRTFDEKLFLDYGISNIWVQENHSRSEKRGIIRGLHFQLPPFSETKLIRCIKGEIFDVFVDLRLNSNTFGEWDSVVLTEENKKMVLIPKGFAHGFLTLTEISEVVYKVDNYYSKEHENGIVWNDKIINVKWPDIMPTLSEKDKNNLTITQFLKIYKGIKI